MKKLELSLPLNWILVALLAGVLGALSTVIVSVKSVRAGGLVLTSREMQDSNSNGSSRTNREVGVALSVGLSLGVTTQATKNDKSLRAKTTFKQRFKAKPRAMTRDLKRRSGPQYKWVVNTLLQIKPSARKRYRCELKRAKEDLNHRLKTAADLKDASIESVYWLLLDTKKESEFVIGDSECIKAS